MDDPVTWDQVHELMVELRALARKLLALEGSRGSLEPEDLVQEALYRQKPAGKDWAEITWPNRSQFFAAAQQAMRKALIDHARMRPVRKRRAPRFLRVDDLRLEHLAPETDTSSEQIVALTDALERLRAQHPEQADVLELRFVFGFTRKETARVLGISERTVRRRWEVARRFLQGEILRSLNRTDASETDQDPHKQRLQGHLEARLTPQLREWLLQQSTEQEIVTELQNLWEKGGRELSEFVHELEQVVHDSERTRP
jgi:RNA polymerase sigma-70 factor, ECF subfamily